MTSDSTQHDRLSAIVSQIALIAAITVLVTFLYRVVQHAMHRNGISAIPIERPDEERRIFHPAGFSMIRPEFWESEVVLDPDHSGEGGIKLRSPSQIKPGATLEVVKLASEPTLRGQVQEVLFQGQPARLSMTHRKAEDGEQPGQFTVELAFSRNNSYWLFRYDLQREQQTIPPRLWEYLETFSSRDPGRPKAGAGDASNPPQADAS